MRLPVLASSMLLALACTGACATTWSCRLTPAATQIVCLALEEEPQLRAEPDPTAPRATVRGTSFPLDPRRRWLIDLWSPATDQEGVEFLARASMCYRSPGCRVVWERR